MDIVGPVTESSNGSKYILVLPDYASRYVHTMLAFSYLLLLLLLPQARRLYSNPQEMQPGKLEMGNKRNDRTNYRTTHR